MLRNVLNCIFLDSLVGVGFYQHLLYFCFVPCIYFPSLQTTQLFQSGDHGPGIPPAAFCSSHHKLLLFEPSTWYCQSLAVIVIHTSDKGNAKLSISYLNIMRIFMRSQKNKKHQCGENNHIRSTSQLQLSLHSYCSVYSTSPRTEIESSGRSHCSRSVSKIDLRSLQKFQWDMTFWGKSYQKT